MKADLILTDPPYNVGYEGKTEERLKIQNDVMADGDFYEFLKQAFVNGSSALKEGGAFYIFCVDNKIDIFMQAVKSADLFYHETLIWVKNAMVLGHLDYHKKHEPCLYGWKKGEKHYFIDSREQTTVFEDLPNVNKITKTQLKEYVKELLQREQPSTVIKEDKPNRNGEHPTMKPIKLLGYLIKNSTKKNDVVLDVFGGSGSTMIACEQLGRKCRMMELDPKYCDVIVKRWETLTGEKAVKV